METVRPSMPPLAPLDGDRRREGEAYHHERNASTHSSSAAPNHAGPQSQGYVSPYSHGPLSLTHLANAASKEFGTPPDSRRASGEDKDAIANQTTRQLLPSISEALGIDSSNAPYPPASLHQQKAPSPPGMTRPYAAEPAQPHGEAHPQKYSAPYHVPPTSYPPSDPARAALSGLRPALHLHTPQAVAYPASAQHSLSGPSPATERPPAVPASATAPAGFPYGYAPYPPRYAQQPATTAATPAPAYHATSGGRPGWEGENNASPRYRSTEKSYGESVKRHLDLYDLESALNDIASASNFLGDFARRYGDLLHQSPRTGFSIGGMPSIIEIEDMIAKSRTQTEALIKISETVIARQAAHDEHKAEMRQQKAYADYDDSMHDLEDSKGPDAKKRRGRAAPPGRCHSCNRAETPEWRRGPDGARTLCNACGLHYAKLTRKANSASKASAVSSSNLRPKESLT